MKQSGHLNPSEETGSPVTSKYGRTPPNKHGSVGRQQQHGGLLHKIKMLGIAGELGVRLYDFLTGRTHFVRLQRGVIFDSPVISGVPQGTVLGQLLFIIRMCDINSGIASSRMVSFADDTRLYYGISNGDDSAILQNDLNSIYEWASGNNMFFMPKSSNIYVLTLILHYLVMFTLVPVYIELTTLDMCLTFVYMCQVIVLSNFILLTKHLTGWIPSTFSSRDKLAMFTLVKALVMSRLDYGSQLWSPYLIKHINMIDKTQRSFTIYISGMQGLSYPERLTVLKLYSLQRRRERYIIIYAWTILE